MVPGSKHENIPGKRFCMDDAKAAVVDRPNFRQLFHRSKYCRIIAKGVRDVSNY